MKHWHAYKQPTSKQSRQREQPDYKLMPGGLSNLSALVKRGHRHQQSILSRSWHARSSKKRSVLTHHDARSILYHCKLHLQLSVKTTPNKETRCKTPPPMDDPHLWVTAQTQDAALVISLLFATDNDNTSLEEQSFKLPNFFTLCQAELTAITEACKLLPTNFNTLILVWIDSLFNQYSVNISMCLTKR